MLIISFNWLIFLANFYGRDFLGGISMGLLRGMSKIYSDRVFLANVA